ncbi:ABC transporter ATP-binding protein [Pararhodobacter sp.]|uniref:ABC transporter ATP-binding protein n=1 Tax=Pararhodobacter sp. TaxID=2127056 RepID=UPI002FDE8B81
MSAATTRPAPARLQVQGATLAYDRRVVSRDLSVAIPDGSFTAIVGPNACGKSTLLRALARILPPKAGSVSLDGMSLDRIPARELARAIGLLPQNPLAPEGITVEDLVARGRYPHQSLLRQWTRADAAAVARALHATRIESLCGRRVSDLSGGQRQRVWIAMVLAQETPILLLDEPTTWLDIAHQVEVMELLARQVRDEGRTIVAVLHELNHAFRYATHVVAMRDGRVVAQGAPRDIVTAGLIETLYDLPCVIAPDPLTGTPMVIPRPAT